MNAKHILLFFLLLLLAVVVNVPAHAQDRTPDIDRIFSWTKADAPGCAVAVSLNGNVVVNRAYGSADLERDVPIRTDSVFDAGSMTKQFVAAATLLLVEEGRIALTDDVRKYVPELPDYGQKITIDHLLTHTSGIRDWTGILPLAPGNPDALRVILRQRALNFAPGAEWSYSNSGYVLLKEIVARVSGTSFADVARKRLFEPLGMKSTSYRMDLREIVKNRALAYDMEGGRWRMSMLLDNDRGGGGALLITTGDFLIWNDALTHERLGKFVTAKLQEPARLNNGRKLAYGRGLFLDSYRGSREIAHTGSAAGYKGYAGRFPEHGLSIAMLCNSGDGTDRRAFAHRIVDLFAPSAAAQRDEAKEAAESAAPAFDVTGRAGLFFNENTGEPLRLTVDRGRLRFGGGPALTPLANDRFRRSGASLELGELEIHFTSDDAFELKETEGTSSRYRRARTYAPAAAELAAFSGRYTTDEIGSAIIVAPGERGLAARLEHSPDRALPLQPVDPDTFQFSRITIRFIRDKDGKVVGLDFSNPMLRNVRFVRAAR